MITIMRYSDTDRRLRKTLMLQLETLHKSYEKAAEPYIAELVRVDARTPISYIMEPNDALETERRDRQDKKGEHAGSEKAVEQHGERGAEKDGK